MISLFSDDDDVSSPSASKKQRKSASEKQRKGNMPAFVSASPRLTLSRATTGDTCAPTASTATCVTTSALSAAEATVVVAAAAAIETPALLSTGAAAANDSSFPLGLRADCSKCATHFASDCLLVACASRGRVGILSPALSATYIDIATVFDYARMGLCVHLP